MQTKRLCVFAWASLRIITGRKQAHSQTDIEQPMQNGQLLTGFVHKCRTCLGRPMSCQAEAGVQGKRQGLIWACTSSFLLSAFPWLLLGFSERGNSEAFPSSLTSDILTAQNNTAGICNYIGWVNSNSPGSTMFSFQIGLRQLSAVSWFTGKKNHKAPHWVIF